MIEKVILDYLNDAIPAYLEYPDDPPQRFVLIEKTGSGRSNRLETATLAIQSYAEDMYAAAVLNETVKSLMYEVDILPDIVRVELNSDYNYTDTATKRYRYQAVFDVVHY